MNKTIKIFLCLALIGTCNNYASERITAASDVPSNQQGKTKKDRLQRLTEKLLLLKDKARKKKIRIKTATKNKRTKPGTVDKLKTDLSKIQSEIKTLSDQVEASFYNTNLNYNPSSNQLSQKEGAAVTRLHTEKTAATERVTSLHERLLSNRGELTDDELRASLLRSALGDILNANNCTREIQKIMHKYDQ